MTRASTSVLQLNEKDQFVDVARQLSLAFPDLDLAFNLQEGSQKMRCFVGTEEPIELSLDGAETRELVFEAIFAIKSLVRRFDS